MIQTREPRKPRIQYHHFIHKQNAITVFVQFSQKQFQIPKRVLSKLRKANQKGYIQFYGDQWNVYGMSQICNKIKEWDVPKGLHIQSIKQPYLIHHMSNIRFSSLKNLNLANNRIQSIEPICSISMPSLERLVLSSNKITSIKSLRKAHIPNLISCSLGGNKIIDLNPLCQLKASVLNSIYQENRADHFLFVSFTWIGKLETDELQRLWVRSDNRIWQRSAQNSFQRKYRKRKEITFYVGLIDNVA